MSTIGAARRRVVRGERLDLERPRDVLVERAPGDLAVGRGGLRGATAHEIVVRQRLLRAVAPGARRLRVGRDALEARRARAPTRSRRGSASPSSRAPCCAC